MNIFLREIKFYAKGLLFWCIGLIVLISSGMAKFSAYSDMGQSMNDIIANFPQSIQAMFGLVGFDLNSATGYIGVMFMYTALMATIHATLLGANIISKEENDRTHEFLFTKPVSRSKAITQKIAAGLTIMIVLNIVSFLSSLFFVGYFTKDNSTAGYNFNLTLGLFIMQLIFFFISTMIAAINKKPKTSASIATSVLLFTFLITYVINLDNKFDFLKYLTPFKYFDAKDALLNNGFSLVFIIISTVIIIASITMTYVYYKKRDLK